MSVLDEVSAIAEVRRGRLFIQHRRQFDELVKNLSPSAQYEVTVKRLRATRSIQANRFYFGVVLATLAEFTGYTVDELHDLMKMKFIPKHLALLDGNGEVHGEFVLGGSTRQMSVQEFTAYIERIRQFAAEELDCNIPDAEGAF